MGTVGMAVEVYEALPEWARQAIDQAHSVALGEPVIEVVDDVEVARWDDQRLPDQAAEEAEAHVEKVKELRAAAVERAGGPDR